MMPLQKGESKIYKDVNPKSFPHFYVMSGSIKAELFKLPDQKKAIEKLDISAGNQGHFKPLYDKSPTSPQYLIKITGMSDFENVFDISLMLP